MELVEKVILVADQILKKKKRRKIIINKRTLEILAVVQVVAVELTQVVERILQVELDKARVDLEMVMAQDKELDKV